MTAQILDGKALSASIRVDIRETISKGIAAGKTAPGLATVLVGEDPASAVYVRNKRRACDETGMVNFHKELPADIGQQALLDVVAELNADQAVHGILVQLPLPKGFDYDENAVLQAIDPAKDADGFHPLNQGALMQGTPAPIPCTPKGVMALLRETGLELSGKHAVVVGRSNIVGKPVSLLLLREHCTVTVCHSRTQDLAAVVGSADVIVAAVGVPELVKGNWVKPGAIVLDVGINRNAEGKLIGDVEFATAAERASWITPVPGGVGPMTIAMLLQNTLEAAWRTGA
ncbi:MAG: bifunctional methylenetetrahydrofolate dehydrogenase/methenyltetrahydrofolate cyclohydrolase FolD [Planctomycetes bacterium]|jgi:methylenetetrahydrofolate dehydrogenase (NADP+)/methenyltetrahydrofolate cyclohydrolase|nr:bifunctional methylenetetrahydrofolate dehydrogenase/methenyltetrahydrofolate cyclohydrolase FolD [Planctomycetota bacterium]MBT4561208.1 bifunctional methylenetetrahydrofolate dehydrogenase/methenyltetrahydrofolate cyclohydrolase FolD [Planctomycetota bacterium]MBT5101337.1 bifunctional methylenetetrahydrofolate dehydrogenase/methenyltetrahydrofolate cyclohydrolase FolD [Planctomycetota bacterium]MBT5120771.1 bifunctional methylenetetrahydrofolate dehydrogenase/methenyltetrahydrofolate cyclo